MKNNRGENPIFRHAREAAQPGRRGVSRRQMVQQLLGSVGGTAALAALAGANPNPLHHDGPEPSSAPPAGSETATPTAPMEWSPQFLDPHQNATLSALAERIVPGSMNAQVNRMVDLLLMVDTQQNKRKFLESLSAFDGEAIQRYRQPFVNLTEEHQTNILTAASTANPGQPKEEDNDGRRDASNQSGEEAPMTLRDHFENLKDWVVKSYYSSEIGLKDLGWTGRVTWESFPGCEHQDGHE